MKYTIHIILLIFVGFKLKAQPSVLSQGDWYKIGVTHSGLYKVDVATLSALGINIQEIIPQKIRIYGNGIKGILDQRNSVSRPTDLIENTVYISGEADRSFDTEDFILFYGIGPHLEGWEESNFVYEYNIYSDTSYYFINIGDASSPDGLRILDKENLNMTPSRTIEEYDDFIIYEEDINNLLGSGRQWFGDILYDNDFFRTSYAVKGILAPATLQLNVISNSTNPSTFEIQINSESIGTIAVDEILDGDNTYTNRAIQNRETFPINPTEDLNLSIRFDNNSAGSGAGYLDYYIFNFKRRLSLYDRQTTFRNIASVDGINEYRINNATSATIWDITNPTTVKNQIFTTSNDQAIFRSQSNMVEEYVIFSGTDFPRPAVFGRIKNQNLKGETHIDGIIITHPNFLSQAQELQIFHSQQDHLNIKVATTSEVFNEFSSGRQDITAIRDYARYVYLHGGKRLKYLLLFGDCSYDYKYRLNENTNYVPTYQSRNSFHPINSYVSDDYYGFLEDEEGEWVENRTGDHTLEIGIGRLPVKTAEEARQVVNKIKHYLTNPASLGKWKNQISYVADDGDANIHAIHVERLSEIIDTAHVQYNISKLLLDAFEKENNRSPQATSTLKNEIKTGTFLVNFIGHGSERLWTEEEIFSSSMIDLLTNLDNLPIFITATCDFGKYDDPRNVSGGEKLLLNPNGGAIALLTTSRLVRASTNFSLNLAFHKNILQKVNGNFQRMGDIVKKTKNAGLEGSINRNFTLLGDPMLLPAYPKYDVVTISNTSNDTLSALKKMTFRGEIRSNNQKMDDFNGKISISVFDIEQTFVTKGQLIGANRGNAAYNTPYNYTLRNNIIFNGQSSVNDGAFSFTFVVPKNISYQYQNSKITFYAWSEEQKVDAYGFSNNIVIGGTHPDAPEDNTPPDIDMYLNHRSFTNGSEVSRSPLLIAHIEDDFGITTTNNGFTNGIILTVNEQSFQINNFYTADTDSYQQGTVIYPIQNLAPGQYTATLQVWDSYNNTREKSISFVVPEKPSILIFNQRIYPNPFSENATISFEHDRSEENLQIRIFLYNVEGRTVYEETRKIENSDSNVTIPLNAYNHHLLNSGIYFYRLVIFSLSDAAKGEISGRIQRE